MSNLELNLAVGAIVYSDETKLPPIHQDSRMFGWQAAHLLSVKVFELVEILESEMAFQQDEYLTAHRVFHSCAIRLAPGSI
ncbi:MAG TPA: hypothetical protein VE944_11475 [Nostoc sp.]|uniref:hypothetical protein n=1 Tax=Nostoc sp. TaxID=1180 RepID=UPI002D2BB1B2|nr:hypothetical protein [Nostoc sp.]HYX14963.1 hypothetical protein [Nostoc sp.]